MSNSELHVCERMEETPITRAKESLKRRSSVFQRRSILLTATDNQTEEFDETRTTNVISPSLTREEDPKKIDEEIEESFDLQAYIDSLKREKQAWHDELQERRTRYRNLVKKKLLVEQNGQEVDLSILTESERNFIEARPNYEHIVKSSKALVDTAVKVAILNQHCTRLHERFRDKMDKKIKEATSKIISMSD